MIDFFKYLNYTLYKKEDDDMDIFCKIINGEIPCKKIYEDEEVVVIMDVNPRSNGHLLVLPKKHYQDIMDIEDNTIKHIYMIAKKMISLLKEKLKCDGVTLEQNNGIAQEVKHFHLHIIPKYEENTKMELEEIYEKLMK